MIFLSSIFRKDIVRTGTIVSILLVEHPVYEGDRDRSLTDGRGHALDIASPHVADRKHSGQARFEEMRSPGERPMRRGELVL